jgi:choice-of-anchor B domain-containing protein
MRVSSPAALVLVAVLLFGPGSATAAMPQIAPNTDARPLTGRVRPCDKGQIEIFECEGVELLAFLPKDSLDYSVGADIWGWHDSTTGREFALLGGESTAFVEVTDPLRPKYLGVLPPHDGIQNHGPQSVKVYQHYAFIGYEGASHGIQVFDLAQLRDVKSPLEFKETAHYDSLANTHTIAVNQETGFLYVNGSNTCGGGLHMIDVRTPTTPAFAGCYPETLGGRNGGYIHDAQCVIYRGPDQQYTGREICVNYAQVGIGIVDVTDKQNPKTISVASYPNVGYTHQGWFTEDQRYIFLNDEADESAVGKTRTIGFDLNDLDDPIVLTEFLNEKTTEVDHNLYIRGRYMYQGNYAVGLRIIDVADPKSPKEVGYLANIGVAWGTYPFFKDEVVGVPTDMGLFLARLQKRQTR